MLVYLYATKLVFSSITSDAFVPVDHIIASPVAVESTLTLPEITIRLPSQNSLALALDECLVSSTVESYTIFVIYKLWTSIVYVIKGNCSVNIAARHSNNSIVIPAKTAFFTVTEIVFVVLGTYIVSIKFSVLLSVMV